ncbi:hypothetical protein [Flavobacterium sp. SM2513]|uniref:hypothetical protein n=1 Tax=Flavobacterium sp. SM2513 TaxID=3424766 RepID=UPI003D7FBCDF
MEKRTDSDLLFSYLERGECKQLLNDDRGAIQDFDKEIGQKPMFSSPFLLRGISKYNLNDVDGACSDWSKGGELGEGEVYKYIGKYCR